MRVKGRKASPGRGSRREVLVLVCHCLEVTSTKVFLSRPQFPHLLHSKADRPLRSLLRTEGTSTLHKHPLASLFQPRKVSRPVCSSVPGLALRQPAQVTVPLLHPLTGSGLTLRGEAAAALGRGEQSSRVFLLKN